MMGKMKKKPMLPRQMPKKPKAKKDEQGRYGMMSGGVMKVDGIMDGNKSARREYGYGGRVSYKDGGYSKAMKKAKPC